MDLQRKHIAPRIERRRCRAVRFSPKVHGRLCLSLSEYTHSELADCWYSPEEEEEMQTDLLLTVRAARGQLKRGMSLSDILSSGTGAGTTLRGIESMVSSSTMRELQRRKIEVVEAVLREQARQREGGFFCDTRLAEASKTKSYGDADVAIERGVGDAAVAAAIVREDAFLAAAAIEQTDGSEGLLDAFFGLFNRASPGATSNSSSSTNSRLVRRDIDNRSTHFPLESNGRACPIIDPHQSNECACGGDVGRIVPAGLKRALRRRGEVRVPPATAKLGGVAKGA